MEIAIVGISSGTKISVELYLGGEPPTDVYNGEAFCQLVRVQSLESRR